MINDDMKDQIPLFDISAPPPPTATATDEPVAKKTPTIRKKKPSPPASVTQTKPAITGKTVKQPVSPAKTSTMKKSVTQKTAQPKISGAVPDGDVRLTANIRQDLHLRLKIEAARRRTTIGELIEEFIEQYL